MPAKTAAEKQNDKLINLQAQQLAAQVANWAATLDFQKERFRLLEMPEFQFKSQLEIDKLAWEKAQGTWERAYKESLLTGYYQGKPTTQWLMDQAKLTGSYNGERTLEGKLTDAQIQDMHDKMKLANDEFLSNVTGYFNGTKTFDREKFEAAQALDGWKFISTLSGPQNAFKQARAIASAPGGLADIMGAFAGQYMIGSGGAVGSGGSGYGAGQLDDMMLGFKGMQNYQYPQQQPGAPAPAGPVAAPLGTPAPWTPPPGGATAPPPAAAPTAPSGPVPGAGITPGRWTEEIRAAVSAWNVAHPGYEADGSAGGFRPVGGGAIIDSPPVEYPTYEEIQAYLASHPGITFSQAATALLTQATASPMAAPAPAPVPGGAVAPVPGFAIPGPNPGAADTRGYFTAPEVVPALASARADYAIKPVPSLAAPGEGYYTAQSGYTYSPPGVQAPTQAYNYSQNMSGSVGVYPPGVASPYQTADISSTAPIAPGAAAAALNPYQYGGPTGQGVTQIQPETAGTQILAPNKINSQNYANMYEYQKDLAWAGYEDAGYDKGLAQESFLRSKPKTGGPKTGTVAF